MVTALENPRFTLPFQEKPVSKDEVDTPLMSMGRPMQQRWSPYVNNGGTCLALAGKGYAIVAADTRLSVGFGIHSRTATKILPITSSVVLASGGMQADRATLHKNIGLRLDWYQYQNSGKFPSVQAISQLLSTMLYQRRFFPYYTFNLLAGIKENGEGVVYSYDAVGCTEPLSYGCTGTGESLIEPLLDNQILRLHNSKVNGAADLNLEEALNLIKDAFTSAAERDIYTGDGVEIFVITPEGTKKELFELRHD
eukprot:NODE_2529_length_1176_cov_37.669033_g2310_i0.p1 GENE.NODE_2529_length_1176_cov_37.669033_g2310_i0~~NODE_2529_length_1176_cov_37.669033_g2310_i0.p1  ORF type:complete len:253 (+),score=44.68 NODE_2529_length_1176_cov_37.669033_g2310_i0:151-909(+)